MEYNKIIAVTGLPGLYELLSSKSDGAIVRSLDDKSTKFVSSRIHNFSHLESIEIFTIRENVNLAEILKAMESSPEKPPEDKESAGLKNYFTKVYPELDFDRVYSSDLKKMVKWFNVLKSNDIEIKLSEPVQEEEQPEEKAAVAKTEDKQTVTEKKQPKKKAVAEEPEEVEEKSPAVEKLKKTETASKEEVPVSQKAKGKAEIGVKEAIEEPKAKKPAKKKAASEEKEESPVEKPKKTAAKKK